MSIFSDIDAEHHREILERIIKKHQDNLEVNERLMYDYTQVKIILEKILQEFNRECVE